jgi:solute carrier family 1 (high affinity glutamate transporter) protein 2
VFCLIGFQEKTKMKSVTKTMEGAKAWLQDNLLLFLTFTGVLSGFVLGTSLRSFDLSQETILLIAYPGELFMRLLKLMILPLIIASLITGAASLNARMNGMIALRTIVYFIITSLLSACVGLVLVIIIHPGNPEVKTLLGSGEKFILYILNKHMLLRNNSREED